MSLTPDERRERKRNGAIKRQRNELAGFRRQVDPDELLPEAERDRQARQMRRERMANMGRASGMVRAQKAAQARVDAYVQNVVDAAPVLTNEQRRKLAGLLGGETA